MMAPKRIARRIRNALDWSTPGGKFDKYVRLAQKRGLKVGEGGIRTHFDLYTSKEMYRSPSAAYVIEVNRLMAERGGRRRKLTDADMATVREEAKKNITRAYGIPPTSWHSARPP